MTLDDGRQIDAKLVIAADGAQSKVRELAGFSVREWSYQQDAIVTTIHCQQHHQLAARQWFLPTGPLAFLPLQGIDDDESGSSCSIVWSQDSAEAERLMALSDEEFCKELTRVSEGALGEILSIDRRFKIPLNQRHAADYVKPGLVLIGDAAHSIHPLAGQGVNLGFKDVAVLAEELARAASLGISPGSELVLQRYQRRRKADNLGMMAVMEGFKRLFGSDQVPLRLLRNAGMSRLNSIMPIKKAIVREVMGLS